ncbi:MAG: hypothetical protein IPM45_17685 [Acidimicrobiales bacterium]|nr:hypothetical protein [Acidimicrobiales bacterium]
MCGCRSRRAGCTGTGASATSTGFDVTYANPGTQTIEYDVCPARWNTNPENPGSFEIKGESCTKGSYTFTVQAPNQPVFGTGDVQVTLAWSDGADLDLHVVDPGGAETWYGNTTSASSGQLDHDTRPQCGDDNTHYENIFWPTTAPRTASTRWSSCRPAGAAPPATPVSPSGSAARSSCTSRSPCRAVAAAPP